MHAIRNLILLLLLIISSAYGERDPCESAPDDEPCANGGKCVVISDSDYKCECSSDFTGEFCELKNLCKYSPCQNGGSCTTFQDIAKCTCPLGYTGIHCEDSLGNINTGKRKILIPKTPSTSKPNVNKEGRSVLKTAVINNDPLRRGFVNPDAVCNDTNPCSNGGFCNEHFECLCNGTGYRGPTCLEEDECHNISCSNHGSCSLVKTRTGNSLLGKCECDIGYDGNDCEKHLCEINPTDSCKNGGNCQHVSATETKCNCPKEFTGVLCELSNLCNNISCLHGEETIIDDDVCRCKCNESFTGYDCSLSNPCKNDTFCLNGGLCIALHDGSTICDCKRGFLNPYCEDEDPCVMLGGNDMCKNGATCERKDNAEFVCRCRIPFEGEHCEILNLCNVDPGECVDDILSTAVGNCYPCKHGGNCTQIDHDKDRYTCICPSGYTGLKCEILDSEELFEAPQRLQVLEEGRFYLQILNPHPEYDYEWHLSTHTNTIARVRPVNTHTNAIKRVSPDMLVVIQAKSGKNVRGRSASNLNIVRGVSVRKEYVYFHAYQTPGIYDIEVQRINTINGERTTVWRNRVVVDGLTYNPLIPTIVITCLVIYIILLFLACSYHLKTRVHRPRLIVSADIDKFEEETFYLLTLQTGNRCDAATSANVACRLYGDQGRSKIYVLRDYKLDTTLRDSESNFLISSAKDLGNMEKIRIWHDNTGYHPSWFCLKIIIREVKKGKYWYFFIRRWLSITSDDTTIVAEAETASEKKIQDYYNEFTDCSHMWLLTKKHHIWISPFLGSSKSSFTVPERLTVAMTLLCIHFFGLILCYGTPRVLHAELHLQFKLNSYVLLQSLKTSPVTVPMGFLLTYLFRSLHEKRVPTLLIWRNKPDMPPIEEYLAKLAAEVESKRNSGFLHVASGIYHSCDDIQELKEIGRVNEEAESSEEEVDEGWDKLDPNRIMVVGVPKPTYSDTISTVPSHNILEIPSSSTSSNEVFRIPSTDMLETRNWISEALDDSQGPVNVAPNDLVHSIRPGRPFSGPDQLVELGIVGGVTSVKDNHPESFVYRTNSNESIEHLIEDDIRKSYINPHAAISKHHKPRHLVDIFASQGNKVTGNVPFETIDEGIQTEPMEKRLKTHAVVDSKTTHSDINLPPVPPPTSVVTQERFLYSMDGGDVCCSENIENLKQVYMNLCEMPLEGHRTTSLTIIAWILCFVIIIITASLTIFYGGYYGRLSSYNWCASLVWGLCESFFIFQPLKIIIVAYIIQHFIEKGAHLPLPVRHNSERFQLYCANGLTVLPRMYHLDYQRHIPDILYRPIIASQIFAWKMESRRKRLLRNGLREVIIYIIFLISLAIISYNYRGVETDLYDSAKTIEDTFLLKDHHSKMSPLAYQNIRSVDHYYAYLQSVFVEAMYYEKDYNNRRLPVQHTDTTIWMYDGVSILIGVPRIRQLRIIEASEEDEKNGVRGTCDMRYQFKADKFTHPTTRFSCSADFWDGYFYTNKDTRNYQKRWEKVPAGKKRKHEPSITTDMWKFHTAQENNSTDHFGSISWYDGSGYIAELGRVEAKTLAVIRYMKQYEWINERTRALFIEFNAYNPHVNIFNSAVLIMERSASLNWIASSAIFSSELDIFKTLTAKEYISFAIFLICTIYFSVISVLSVTKSFKTVGFATVKNLWLWIDVAIPVVSISCIVLYWESYYWVEKKVEELKAADPDVYVDLSQAIIKTYHLMYIFAGIMVLAVCKLWRLLVISSRSFFALGFLFSITTSYSMHFLLIFMGCHIAFASFYYKIFGTREQRCMTIGSAILHSLYSTRFPKDVGFENLYTSDSSFGPIYFFGYNALIYVFILNVFISIYTLGLQEAKETAIQRPFKSSYGTYIWMRIQAILPRVLRQKFTTRAHITPARLNAMKRIAICTLRSALNSPSPAEKRMMEMKVVAANYLKHSSVRLITTQHRMDEKIRKIMLISEDRLNTMRELTVNFIRARQNIDFDVEELKKYEDFDFTLLEIQLKKLKRKVQLVDQAINNILQKL